MSTAGSWLRRSVRAPAWPRSAPPGPAPAEFRAGGAPSAFPASVCRPCAPPVAGSVRSQAIRAAPPASFPPRRPRWLPEFRRRCRRRPCCDAPVPRHAPTRHVELSGRREHGTSSGVAASPPRRARAEVHGLYRWGDWPKPCPYPSLATRASPKCAAFPTPSCVVSTIIGTMPRSDSLRTVPAFACGLYRALLPPLSTSRTGAVGPPLLTDRPSLHAISFTPKRVRAAPDSMARTAVFAQKRRARPARSLTGCSFDAAEFTSVTACSFAPPRFDAGLSPDAGEFASPLLWRLAGAGLTPADRSALCRAHRSSNCPSDASSPSSRDDRRASVRWMARIFLPTLRGATIQVAV